MFRSFSVTHPYLDDNPTVTPFDDYVVNIVSLTDSDGAVAEARIGGNIFLTGHDPDFHAVGTAEPGAKNLLRAGLKFATTPVFATMLNGISESTGQPAKSKPSKEKAPPSTRVMSSSSCPMITVVPLYIQKLTAFPACMS